MHDSNTLFTPTQKESLINALLPIDTPFNQSGGTRLQMDTPTGECQWHKCRKPLYNPKQKFCTKAHRTQYYYARRVAIEAQELLRESPDEVTAGLIDSRIEAATAPLLATIRALQDRLYRITLTAREARGLSCDA
jgi:hypothetical protein